VVISLQAIPFHHRGTKDTEIFRQIYSVFSVSLWLFPSKQFLFTTEAQRTQRSFDRFTLCSLCLCGYFPSSNSFSPQRHKGHRDLSTDLLCVLRVSVVISLQAIPFHHRGTKDTEVFRQIYSVFSVSLWLFPSKQFLFTTEAQRTQRSFDRFTLCSPCLCGYFPSHQIPHVFHHYCGNYLAFPAFFQ
jgi:hypothetical protein